MGECDLHEKNIGLDGKGQCFLSSGPRLHLGGFRRVVVFKSICILGVSVDKIISVGIFWRLRFQNTAKAEQISMFKILASSEEIFFGRFFTQLNFGLFS